MTHLYIQEACCFFFFFLLFQIKHLNIAAERLPVWMELRLFHKILSSESVIEYIWQDSGLQLILNVGLKKKNVL